jgi:hypothetical protein
MAKRLGVIITVEALLATLLLFGLLLLVIKLSNLDDGDSAQLKILRSKSQHLAFALQSKGVFNQIFEDNSDAKMRDLMDEIPAGICSQVEIYNSSISKTNLVYSFRSTDCQIYDHTPISSTIFMHSIRESSNTVNFYFVRVSTYARG